jgi:hypothetical protein
MESKNPPPPDSAGNVPARNPEPPCIIQAMVRGSIGFGIVSLAAFSVWAAAGKWFQIHFGEAGLYGACALVFICSSGLLLHQLMLGPGSLLRFYAVFIPAFLAYAVAWCAAWFLLRFGVGEWLGSFLGTAAFAGALGWRFQNYRNILRVSLVLFGFHSAGYFLGGRVMKWILGPAGSAMLTGLSRPGLFAVAQLSWGLLYGLGFGAGIGYAFYTVQSSNGCVPRAT